jgi:broad specificity phosphatase PhoE
MGWLERWVRTAAKLTIKRHLTSIRYLGGESIEEIQSRVDGVIEKIRAYHKEYLEEGTVSRDVMIVAHGHFGRILTARWVGFPAAYGKNPWLLCGLHI